MMSMLRTSSHSSKYEPFIYAQKRSMGTKNINDKHYKTEAGRRLPNRWKKGVSPLDTPPELYTPTKKAEKIYAALNLTSEMQKQELAAAKLLHEAIKARNIELVKQLLDSGVDTSIRVDGVSAVFCALDEGAQEAMRILLCHPAPVTPHTEEEIYIIKNAMQKSSSEEKKSMVKLIGCVSSIASAIITPLQE